MKNDMSKDIELRAPAAFPIEVSSGVKAGALVLAAAALDVRAVAFPSLAAFRPIIVAEPA